MAVYYNYTLRDTALYLYNGDVAVDTVLSSGGVLFVSSGGSSISGTIRANGVEDVSLDGFSYRTVIRSQGIQIVGSGGLAEGATVSSGGLQLVESAGRVLDTVVERDGVMVISRGASADGTVVNSDGRAVISGFAANLHVNSGGQVADFLHVGENSAFIAAMDDNFVTGMASGVIFTGSMSVGLGGETFDTEIISGGNQIVNSGGEAFDTLVSGGGVQDVVSGGMASNTTIVGDGVAGGLAGSQMVYYGGVASDTLVSAGGAQYVFFEGIASNTVIRGNFNNTAGGSQRVSAGGLARDTVVSSGARQFVELGGVVSNTIVSSGGRQFVEAGGRADSTIVLKDAFAAGVYHLGDAPVLITRITDGEITGSATGLVASGSMFVGTDGLVKSTVLVADGDPYAGGRMYVRAGGSAVDTVLGDYSIQYVYAGGSAADTEVYFNAAQYVYGAVSDTRITSGGYQNVYSGGVAAAVTVESGGRIDIYSSGAAGGVHVLSGGFISAYAGGMLSGDLVVGGLMSVVSSTRTGGKFDAAGNTITFAVSERLVYDYVMIDDVSLIANASYNVSVAADQEKGIYKLAGRAYGFAEAITVTADGVALGTISVGGPSLSTATAIYSLSVDSARNLLLTIDETLFAAPQISADIVSPTNSDVTLFVRAPVQTAVTEYSFDGQLTWTALAGNSLVVTENGSYFFRCVDAAGAVSDIALYEVANIDKIAPDAPVITVSTELPTNRDVIVTGIFSPDSARRQYSYNGRDWYSYPDGAGELLVTVNCTVYMRGIDAAGNVSAVSSVVIANIDPDLRTVTVANLSADPAVAQSLPWAVGRINTGRYDRIVFAPELAGQTIVIDGALDFTSAVSIIGPMDIAASGIRTTSDINCDAITLLVSSANGIELYENGRLLTVNGVVNVVNAAGNAAGAVVIPTGGDALVSLNFILGAAGAINVVNRDAAGLLHGFAAGVAAITGDDDNGMAEAILAIGEFSGALTVEAASGAGIHAEVSGGAAGAAVVSAGAVSGSLTVTGDALAVGINVQTGDGAGSCLIDVVSGDIAAVSGGESFGVRVFSGTGEGNITGSDTDELLVSGVIVADGENSAAIFGNVDKSIRVSGVLAAGNYQTGGGDAMKTLIASLRNRDVAALAGTIALSGGFAIADYAVDLYADTGFSGGVADDSVVLATGALVLGDIALAGGTNTLTIDAGARLFGTISADSLELVFDLRSAAAAEPVTVSAQAGAIAAESTSITLDFGTVAGVYTLAQAASGLDALIGRSVTVISGGRVFDVTVGGDDGYNFIDITVEGDKLVATYTGSPDSSAPVVTRIGGTTADEVRLAARFAEDAVLEQYSLDGKHWRDYTDSGVVVTNNGIIYFRSVDATGLASGITEYTVGSIDPLTDNLPDGASLIGIGESAAGWVGPGDAQDYYRFTVGADGDFGISLAGISGKNIKATLGTLNSKGAFKAIRSVSGNAKSVALQLNAGLGAGVYYVRIESADKGRSKASDYELSIVEYPSDNTDDTWKLVRGGEVSGAGDELSGWVGYGDTADYYRIQLDAAGRVKLVCDDLTLDALDSKRLKLTLRSDNGGKITLKRDGDVWTSTRALAAGTDYYLGVSTASASKYNVDYSLKFGTLA